MNTTFLLTAFLDADDTTSNDALFNALGVPDVAERGVVTGERLLQWSASCAEDIRLMRDKAAAVVPAYVELEVDFE